MIPRYARNICPPAHSGFAAELESLEADWEALDGWWVESETEEESMTKVPEAITARLQEIEDNIARALEQQQMDSTQAAQLGQQAADLKVAIADRRRGIRGWKLQRDALRYAVDAIEGRVIYAGTVEIPTTEPFVERVATEESAKPRPLKEETGSSTKETVYATMMQLGPALPRQIAAAAGLGDGRSVGAILGFLRKEGKAIRTEEGLWGPAHQ